MKHNLLLLILALFILASGFYYWKNTKTVDDNPAVAVAEKEAVRPTQDQPPVQQARQSMSKAALQKRDQLTIDLLELLNCPTTHSCPEDNSDPRASSILLGKMLAEKLQRYLQLHLDENYFDQESLMMVQKFIDYPDGHVQQQAISLMSNQQADISTGRMLIDALADSYNAKIMNQSMLELQRYPTLDNEIRALLQQSLQTGSFYVAQEIAANILPFLNSDNIDSYIEIANQLPQRSKRARFLRANIKEFQLRQTGG